MVAVQTAVVQGYSIRGSTIELNWLPQLLQSQIHMLRLMILVQTIRYMVSQVSNRIHVFELQDSPQEIPQPSRLIKLDMNNLEIS